jgi:transcriptional regulator with XRE-family HTH domain
MDRLEKGLITPSLYHLSEIAKALNVDLSELVNLD